MLLILSYLFSVKISLKITPAPDDNFRPLFPEEFILAMSCPSYKLYCHLVANPNPGLPQISLHPLCRDGEVRNQFSLEFICLVWLHCTTVVVQLKLSQTVTLTHSRSVSLSNGCALLCCCAFCSIFYISGFFFVCLFVFYHLKKGLPLLLRRMLQHLFALEIFCGL